MKKMLIIFFIINVIACVIYAIYYFSKQKNTEQADTTDSNIITKSAINTVHDKVNPKFMAAMQKIGVDLSKPPDQLSAVQGKYTKELLSDGRADNITRIPTKGIQS